jgi:hypothetical protein
MVQGLALAILAICHFAVSALKEEGGEFEQEIIHLLAVLAILRFAATELRAALPTFGTLAREAALLFRIIVKESAQVILLLVALYARIKKHLTRSQNRGK